MTDKPEISRNDLAALTILKKAMERLQKSKARYDERLEDMQISYVISQFNQHPATLTTHQHIMIPDWNPDLTEAEYAALEAWANGEDVMLHVLSKPR